MEKRRGEDHRMDVHTLLDDRCIGGLPRVALDEPQTQRWKQLDLGGVSILTAALILFIFAITSGSTVGWGSAEVIAPLVISVFGVAGFFIYETRIPASTAAV